MVPTLGWRCRRRGWWNGAVGARWICILNVVGAAIGRIEFAKDALADVRYQIVVIRIRHSDVAFPTNAVEQLAIRRKYAFSATGLPDLHTFANSLARGSAGLAGPATSMATALLLLGLAPNSATFVLSTVAAVPQQVGGERDMTCPPSR